MVIDLEPDNNTSFEFPSREQVENFFNRICLSPTTISVGNACKQNLALQNKKSKDSSPKKLEVTDFSYFNDPFFPKRVDDDLINTDLTNIFPINLETQILSPSDFDNSTKNFQDTLKFSNPVDFFLDEFNEEQQGENNHTEEPDNANTEKDTKTKTSLAYDRIFRYDFAEYLKRCEDKNKIWIPNNNEFTPTLAEKKFLNEAQTQAPNSIRSQHKIELINNLNEAYQILGITIGENDHQLNKSKQVNSKSDNIGSSSLSPIDLEPNFNIPPLINNAKPKTNDKYYKPKDSKDHFSAKLRTNDNRGCANNIHKPQEQLKTKTNIKKASPIQTFAKVVEVPRSFKVPNKDEQSNTFNKSIKAEIEDKKKAQKLPIQLPVAKYNYHAINCVNYPQSKVSTNPTSYSPLPYGHIPPFHLPNGQVSTPSNPQLPPVQFLNLSPHMHMNGGQLSHYTPRSDKQSCNEANLPLIDKTLNRSYSPQLVKKFSIVDFDLNKKHSGFTSYGHARLVNVNEIESSTDMSNSINCFLPHEKAPTRDENHWNLRKKTNNLEDKIEKLNIPDDLYESDPNMNFYHNNYNTKLSPNRTTFQNPLNKTAPQNNQNKNNSAKCIKSKRNTTVSPGRVNCSYTKTPKSIISKSQPLRPNPPPNNLKCHYDPHPPPPYPNHAVNGNLQQYHPFCNYKADNPLMKSFPQPNNPRPPTLFNRIQRPAPFVYYSPNSGPSIEPQFHIPNPPPLPIYPNFSPKATLFCDPYYNQNFNQPFNLHFKLCDENFTHNIYNPSFM